MFHWTTRVTLLLAMTSVAQGQSTQTPLTQSSPSVVNTAEAGGVIGPNEGPGYDEVAVPAWTFAMGPTFRYASTRVSQASRRHGFGITGTLERRVNRFVGVQGSLLAARNSQLDNIVWPSLQEVAPSLSLVMHARPGSNFRPYALAGAGYDFVSFSHPRCDCGSKMSFATSHVGAGFSAGPSDFVSLLAEGNVQTGHGNAWSLLSGVSFAFGPKHRPPVRHMAVIPVTPPPALVAPDPVVIRRTDTVTVVRTVERTVVTPAPAPPPPPPVPEALLTLPGAFFGVNQATLHSEAEQALDELASRLNGEFRDVRIEITGYTDNTGSAAHNNALGLRRAEAVRAYLVKKGVDLARINALSAGENNPVASNDTPEGRQLNRRVVIRKR